MAILFDNITEFKKFVSVTTSTELDSFDYKIKHSAKKYLECWIGKPLLDQLIQDHPTSLSVAHQALLPYVQAPLAHFSVHEWLPENEVSISDSGVLIADGPDFKVAFPSQIRRIESRMLENGWEALEYLLEFLENNDTSYPLWVSSDAYDKNAECFINSARDFSEQYDLYLGRRTLERIRPIMKDVECFSVEPCLGKPFYDELKQKLLNRTPFTPEEEELVKLLKKMIAFMTIRESVAQKWVKISDMGVTYEESDTGSKTKIEKTATNDQASVKIRQANDRGDRYAKKVREYLSENVASFPTYESWLEQQQAETDDCGCDSTGSGRATNRHGSGFFHV